jgi:hypothetical protein
MAIFALIANTFKAQGIICGMAGSALKVGMYIDQRESCRLMELLYIVYLPTRSIMTAFAIDSYGLLMNILMTGKTIDFSIRENQRCMTSAAIYLTVTPF